MAGASNTGRGRVFRDVRAWIENGTVADGEPLPSERALAERFGVDRRTVRGALNMLGDAGLLRSNGGRLRLAVKPRRLAPALGSRLMGETIALLASPRPVEPDPRMSHGWSNHVTAGAVRAVQDAGMSALTISPDQMNRETIEALVAHQPFGAVVPEYEDQIVIADWAAMLQECGIQVVIHGDWPEVAAFDRVTSDHEAGAYAATRWLIEHGRRRIINVWPDRATQYWMPPRARGYRRAMTDAGLEPEPVIFVPFNRGDLVDEARIWAGYLVEHMNGSRGADAIMLSSDGHVPVAWRACELFGKRPNTDIAIAGYDNYWADLPEASATWPLITVDKRNDLLGERLIRLLLDRRAGGRSDECIRDVVAPELIEVD